MCVKYSFESICWYTKYLKPYVKDLNKKVELFFTLFERMKNECFKDDNTVSLKILLLSIYTSIIVLHTIRTAPRYTCITATTI